MAKLKESDIREKMEKSINEMFAISVDQEKEEGKRIYAANALSGLVSRYKEMFGFEPEEKGELQLVGKKKNISGYKK